MIIHNIMDLNHRPLGRVDDDGLVFDMNERKVGRVSEDGVIYDAAGNHAGRLTNDGTNRVYNFAGQEIGVVHANGEVLDIALRVVGYVMAPHQELAGAALLLLFR